MFGSDRSDRPALIVLALLVTSLVIVSLSGLYARHEAGHPIACYTPADEDGEEVEKQNPVCPDDHIFFGDGWAQWIMAGFAIVATGVSWRALYLLRETFKETKRTADAAAEANEMARESAERQLRAYVSVEAITIQTLAVGEPLAMVIKIANAGNTPAKCLRVNFGITITDDLSKAPIMFPLPWRPEIEIGPGKHMEFPMGMSRPLGQARHDAIRQNRVFAVVGGAITYRDVFGRKPYTLFKGHIDMLPNDAFAMATGRRHNKSN
jgi:hypothetical protein